MKFEVRDERDRHRYAAYHGGRHVGTAEWILVHEVILLPHLQVEPAYHDAGVGASLMRRIMADADAEGRTALPLCPFSRRWTRRHTPQGAATVRLPGELEGLHAALSEADSELWAPVWGGAPHGPPTS